MVSIRRAKFFANGRGCAAGRIALRDREIKGRRGEAAEWAVFAMGGNFGPLWSDAAGGGVLRRMIFH
ncbi:MAG: hypothetical protein BGO12_19715 [Verrucomicrobia bacterium 61-8]|nr:MAG: hypothetical protein BGO12_19715 [Verrucomicrobia bacterium 61-8]